MSEEHKKGMNADLVWEDLLDCCMEGEVCTQCQEEACSIGYAKKCIKDYQKAPKKEIAEGTDKIPTTDFKVYDPHKLETAIAHILKECKDCKEDHTENCIINVIRNCYEVGLFGDIHSYEGSALQYLMYLKAISPESAGRIADIYMS